MSINAKQREEKSFEKQVGIFEASVLAINPSLAELATIYGGTSSRDEEPKYLVEDKEVKIGEGEDEQTIFVKALRVVAVLQDKKKKSILNAQFYLEDRDRVNRDGTNMQFINSRCSTTWAAD